MRLCARTHMCAHVGVYYLLSGRIILQFIHMMGMLLALRVTFLKGGTSRVRRDPVRALACTGGHAVSLASAG